MAVNSSSVAVAAWDQFSYDNGGGATIGAAVQVGGKWTGPFTVSGTAGFSMAPRVAVGDDGTLAITWTYQDPATAPSPQERVQVAVKPAAGTQWTVSTLATWVMGGVSIIPSVPAAIDGAGNVTVAWWYWDGTRHQVQTAILLNGSKDWGPTATVSGNDDGLFLDLAVNSRGDAAIAYSLSPYSSYASGTWASRVSRTGASGSWSSPVQVSESISSTVGYVTGPQIALDANGFATVIYMGFGLEANRQTGVGTWTGPRQVIGSSVPGTSFLSPDLAIDDSGNAVVAVSMFDPTINVDRASVWVALGSPTGTWTRQQRLTDPAASVDAYSTRVAVSADGALTLVGWVDHYHGTVQAVRLTAAGWSAPDTIGRGTAWGSFQEVLGLDVGSSSVARAIWKNTKSGTQIMAASYGR